LGYEVCGWGLEFGVEGLVDGDLNMGFGVLGFGDWRLGIRDRGFGFGV
jgi:hypothetical protein